MKLGKDFIRKIEIQSREEEYVNRVQVRLEVSRKKLKSDQPSLEKHDFYKGKGYSIRRMGFSYGKLDIETTTKFETY